MSRLAVIGIAIVAVFVLVAIFAPWIATQDVGATNLSMRYMAPSAAHWFGTDSTGRDIFSRVVFGARISLEVGIVVVAVSALVGTTIGAVAGYYSGWSIGSCLAISSMCSWRFRDCFWQLPWSLFLAPG